MLTEAKIEHLNLVIEEGFGTPEEMAKQLDKVIEMIFYVDEESFDKKDMQNAMSVIKSINDSLRV